MHWFDITVFVLAAISVVYGFTSGLIRQLALLVGIVLGGIFSGIVADKLYPFMEKHMHMEAHIMAPLSYVLAFLLIMILVIFVGTMLQSVLKAIKLDFLNRLAGAAFCLAFLMFVMSICLNLLVEFDRDKSILSEETRTNTYTFSIVQSVAPTVVPYLRFDWLDKIDKN